MNNCTSCGGSFAPLDVFCGGCGGERPIPAGQSGCQSCGSFTSPQSEYCGVCGNQCRSSGLGGSGGAPRAGAPARNPPARRGGGKTISLWGGRKSNDISAPQNVAGSSPPRASPPQNRPPAPVSRGPKPAKMNDEDYVQSGGTSAAMANHANKRERELELQRNLDPVNCFMTIRCESYEIVKKDSGKPDYVEYHLTVSVDQQSWMVRRRAGEFSSLSSWLKLGMKVPSTKSSLKFADSFLHERQRALDDMVCTMVGMRAAIFAQGGRPASEFVKFILPSKITDEKSADFLFPFDMLRF
jgi:hypothetical protein